MADQLRHQFTCQYSTNDTLDLELTAEGDLRLTVHDGTDKAQLSFYVRPEDTTALARAVASLSAERRRQLQGPAVVPRYMTQGMPVPPMDNRTPEQVEADEMESKRQRREASGNPVTFAEAMLPQPGTADRERAYLRATEMLGEQSSIESRVEMARFLMGQGRWS